MVSSDVGSYLACRRFEIRKKLKTQGVVEVHCITVKKEGKVIPTNTLFLMFNQPTMPKEIVVCYLKVKVDLFVPNTLRRFNCNKFSHTSQHCRTTAKCQWYGKDKHEEQCDGPLICSNCNSPHAVSAKDCPVWKKEEIQCICVEKPISFPEARQLVEAIFSWWLNLWSVRQISPGFLQTLQCRLLFASHLHLVVPDQYQLVLRLPPGS